MNQNTKTTLFKSSGYFDAIGELNGGSQSIVGVYVKHAKIWLELRDAYNINLTKEEAKKVINLLSKGVNVLAAEYEGSQKVKSWQPINTAPKDGTVILTDCGTAKFYGPRCDNDSGWYCCDSYGSVFYCSETGYEFAICNPSHWMSIPPLPDSKNH